MQLRYHIGGDFGTCDSNITSGDRIAETRDEGLNGCDDAIAKYDCDIWDCDIASRRQGMRA